MKDNQFPKKNTKPLLQKPCNYNYPGCQKITDLQYIKKLGTVTLYKTWICDNCLAILEKPKN